MCPAAEGARKDRPPEEKGFVFRKNKFNTDTHKVPLRDVVGLKSRGCRKLKRVDTEHRRSCVYERCEVHWCCTAAAAVVPLLTVLPGCFRDPEEVWVGIVPLCVEDGSPA